MYSGRCVRLYSRYILDIDSNSHSRLPVVISFSFIIFEVLTHFVRPNESTGYYLGMHLLQCIRCFLYRAISVAISDLL